jgi:putative spermidine/putrescine transport system ATP-binding protein
MNSLPAEVTSATTLKIYGQTVNLREGEGGAPTSKTGMALIRPEQLTLTHGDGSGPASATIINLTFLGPLTRISVRMTGDGSVLFISMPSAMALDFPTGSTVNVEIRATSVLLDF